MSFWLSPEQRDVEGFACFGSSGTCAHVAFEGALEAGGTAPLVAYLDDYAAPGASPFDGLPVVSLDTFRGDPRFAGVPVLVPVSDPAGRRRVVARLDAAGIPLVGMPGSPVYVHPSVRLGRGSMVLTTTRLGPGVSLGEGVLCLADVVAHHGQIGDYVTLAMHSKVLGHVEIGNDVFVGAGALITDGTTARPRRIGDGAVIGAGAVVDRDVAPGELVVGARAMTVREWARLRLAARGRRG